MSRPPIDISEHQTHNQAQAKPEPVVPETAVSSGDVNEEPIASLRTIRAQVEIKAILAALKRTGWNRKQAARLLKISYRGLLYKIRRHNITAA